MGAIPSDSVDGMIVMGELSLDGTITGVNGVLAAAIGASSKKMGLICPAANGEEAAWGGDVKIISAPSLMTLINHLRGDQVLSDPKAKVAENRNNFPDMADLVGQDLAKRAMEITAVGGHNLLMMGPPGSGKSMLASRLAGILPPMLAKESLEVTMIHSIAGYLDKAGLIVSRPYRDPHHSSSVAALVGGGVRALGPHARCVHKQNG